MYNKRSDIPLNKERNNSCSGVVEYKRLNTLGFVRACDRIANIMQSGQRLQEAREEQYSYVGKDLSDPFSKDEQKRAFTEMEKTFDSSGEMPPQYADKMDTADAISRLDSKARAVKASKESYTAKLAQQALSVGEPLEPKTEPKKED